MSSTRSTLSPGVFAANASTTIPPTPIAGVPYRNAVSGTATIADGWPFADKVDSAEFNQIMYQLTTVVQDVDRHGVLGWAAGVAYQHPAAVFGSDGQLYLSLQSSTGQDPLAAPAFWSTLASRIGQSVVPAGMPGFFAGVGAPAGWLVADGSAVPRADFPRLFAAIGVMYGAGNGSTTFNLPDTRGYFGRFADIGRGVDPGRTVGSVQGQSIQSHDHTVSIPLVQHTASTANYGVTDGPASAPAQTYSVSPSGGTETRPVNIAFTGIISY